MASSGNALSGGQAEKMVLSPPRPQEEFTFIKPAVPRPVTPAPIEPITQSMEAKPNYQLMPRGTSLLEPPLTQLYVWVHYKINKLPVPKWGAELSQLKPAEVKEFQAWCLWAGNLRQKYGDWAAIPVIVIMTRMLWSGRVHKTPSQAYPGLRIRWGTYVSIASGDTVPDFS